MAGAIGRGVPHGLVVGIGVAVAIGLGLWAVIGVAVVMGLGLAIWIGDRVAGPMRPAETLGLPAAVLEQATTASTREQIETIWTRRTVRTFSSSSMQSLSHHDSRLIARLLGSRQAPFHKPCLKLIRA